MSRNLPLRARWTPQDAGRRISITTVAGASGLTCGVNDFAVGVLAPPRYFARSPAISRPVSSSPSASSTPARCTSLASAGVQSSCAPRPRPTTRTRHAGQRRRPHVGESQWPARHRATRTHRCTQSLSGRFAPGARALHRALQDLRGACVRVSWAGAAASSGGGEPRTRTAWATAGSIASATHASALAEPHLRCAARARLRVWSLEVKRGSSRTTVGGGGWGRTRTHFCSSTPAACTTVLCAIRSPPLTRSSAWVAGVPRESCELADGGLEAGL